MKMSSGFRVIASGISGHQYGHVPGHTYHDVEVGVGRKGSQYRAVVLETWGSAQGYDEEHGRRKVVARGTDARDCLAECVARAHAAGIGDAGNGSDGPYLPMALSECEDELETALAAPSDAEIDDLAKSLDGLANDAVYHELRRTYGDRSHEVLSHLRACAAIQARGANHT